MSFRFHSISHKRNVLMLGLFAVVGFNTSLNLENSHIRTRSIAAAAEGKADLSSEAEFKKLKFELNEILSQYDQGIEVEVAKTKVKEGDKVRAKIDYRVIDRRAETEGRSLETCGICNNGMTTSISDVETQLIGDDNYIKHIVEQALAKREAELQAETDKDKKEREESLDNDEEHEDSKFSENDVNELLKKSKCKTSNLSKKLECQNNFVEALSEKCEDGTLSQKKKCQDVLVKYYSEKMSTALSEGLRSEDSDERSEAVTLRNNLISKLSKNSLESSAIKQDLVLHTREALATSAQNSFLMAKERGLTDSQALLFARQQLTREMYSQNGTGLCRALAANDCSQVFFGEQMTPQMMQMKANRDMRLSTNQDLNLFVSGIENPLNNWMMLPETQALQGLSSGAQFGQQTNSVWGNQNQNQVTGGATANWQLRPGSPRISAPGLQACNPSLGNCPVTGPTSVFGSTRVPVQNGLQPMQAPGTLPLGNTSSPLFGQQQMMPWGQQQMQPQSFMNAPAANRNNPANQGLIPPRTY